MLLATDLAAVDHHEGTITLIANAINWDATDERVDEAYDDAVARLDRMTVELAAPAPSHGRGLPARRAAVHPAAQPGRAPRGGRDRQGADPGRRGVPDRGVAALRGRLRRPTRWTSTGCCGPPTRARTCTCCGWSPPGRRQRFDVVGSSPEALVTVRDGQATTHPIAGTRWRGATEEEDLLLEKELRTDEKERAEHVMLVDLGRNDLGRVCAAGHGEGAQLLLGGALQPRHAPGLDGHRDAARRAQRVRRGHRVLPGRHPVRGAEAARHGDHRGAGADPARALRRDRRLPRLRR